MDTKLWGYSSFDPTAPYDLFDFRVSGLRDGPVEYLQGYTGNVMADCYSGNTSVILAPGSKMTRMAYWSHARRHVYEHQSNDQKVASLPLALMDQLYDIERRSTYWSNDPPRIEQSMKATGHLIAFLESCCRKPKRNNPQAMIKPNPAAKCVSVTTSSCHGSPPVAFA